MIDIHSHILYGVDDGPKSRQQSLELIQVAVKEGITDIISTSHILHPQYNNASADVVRQQIAELQLECTQLNIPIKLHIGNEIRINEEMPRLLQKQAILPLAKSKYVLVELPSNSIPNFTKSMLTKLQEYGYMPIIAHPERNTVIAGNPNKLSEFIHLGAATQITAGSLAGHFGKDIQKLSLELVEANLIHCYASDVHHIKNRPYLYDAGLTYLEKHKLADSVELLLENNERVLHNDLLKLYEPQKVNSKKWWKLF